ncbi:heme ABC transporter ATP-binding protein [Rurimicrobium arvi]|uniref:Heme ABC transporter ATP-binding protein n=1 Tax=Rurimicrobium arvi TaxID=2049916 RepID=A0ABP8MHE7_9BACT
MITVKDLSYRVSAALNLKRLSFDIRPGGITAILGPNGAGKSTLIKLITGVLQADDGNIFLNHLPLTYWRNTDGLAQIAAVLHQQHTLQLPFTVKEIVMMGRYPHFKTRETEKDHRIVEEVMQQLGVHHLSARNVLTLSGGEQQRVHLARVLAQVSGPSSGEPKFLFMDEPSNNLDIVHQHTLLHIAGSFARKGNCVLVVLHDLNLALQYADNILLLQSGSIKASGHPETILSDDLLSEVYGFPLSIIRTPHCRHPIILAGLNTEHQKQLSCNHFKNQEQCPILS